MRNLGLLVARLTVGTLLAGHGAQKLFGWFEGPGPEGTAGFMESLGLKPGSRWGQAAGLSEFGGGVLTGLGFLNPIGPLGVMAAMTVATAKVHWGKPVWASKGGPELPLVNMAATLLLAIEGPGAYSLDSRFGIRLPRWLSSLAILGTIVGLIAAIRPELVEQVTSSNQARTTSDKAA